jgi:NADH dehydrogenase
MKTIDDALNIRNHLLLTIEHSIRSNVQADKERLANIVIAGGGPTGVEMAGMIAEMSRNIVSKDYPEVVKRAGSIYLIDGAPSLLGPMSKRAQDEALRVLKDLGVCIILSALVKDYVDDTVVLSNGQNIPAATLIWSSGVVGRDVKGLPAELINKAKRVSVDEYNRLDGISNIFVIGDLAYQTSDKQYPNGHPQLAQVAIQQGNLLGRNLKAIIHGKKPSPFYYKNKGSMAIISKYQAVVDLPKGFIKGFVAWLVWLFIHIIPLVGFRNRTKLALNWLFSFITNDPTLRLVIRPQKRKS